MSESPNGQCVRLPTDDPIVDGRGLVYHVTPGGQLTVDGTPDGSFSHIVQVVYDARRVWAQTPDLRWHCRPPQGQRGGWIPSNDGPLIARLVTKKDLANAMASVEVLIRSIASANMLAIESLAVSIGKITIADPGPAIAALATQQDAIYRLTSNIEARAAELQNSIARITDNSSALTAIGGMLTALQTSEAKLAASVAEVGSSVAADFDDIVGSVASLRAVVAIQGHQIERILQLLEPPKSAIHLDTKDATYTTQPAPEKSGP